MTHHSRLPKTCASAGALIIICVAASFLLLQLATIDAYSIVPSRGRHVRSIQSRNTRYHWHSKPQSSLPTTPLWSARSFEYNLRNATSSPSAVLDEDEIRLLQFMEDALMELESFQSYDENDASYKNTRNLDNEKAEEEDTHDHFAVSESGTVHDELSLLFPPVEARATAALVNDATASASSLAVSSSSDIALPSSSDNLEGIWRARWLLVAAAALYGTNFSVVKLLGDEMPVGISTSLRFGLAALATLPWLVQGYLPGTSNNTVNNNNTTDKRVMATLYGLEVGFWNSIGYVAQAVGLETTLASESAFLCSMAVVIVPLLDWIAGKKLLSRQWVGALMALVGVAFLELGDLDSLTNGSLGTGAQLSLIQPFSFGLGFWRMEQAMHKYPEEAPRMTAAQLMAIFVSAVGYALWTMGFLEDPNQSGFQSALASVSTAFPWREWSTSPSILFSLFWTGCITTALTIYMETLALESLSAAETTLIFSTEPLWGTAFAVLLMGEQMGMNSVVGGGLILIACVYSNLGVSGLQDLLKSTLLSNNNTTVGKTTRRQPPPARTSSSSLSRSLQDHWPWLLSGSTAMARRSHDETQEFDAIVEELIENLDVKDQQQQL